MAELTEGGAIAGMSLRERKKHLTRQALLAAADRLFEARGYDNVTVAEIADAANISVKTLFTYFASKEDLAFADEGRLRDAVTGAIARSPDGTAPLDAAAAELRRMVQGPGPDGQLDGIEGYHRAFGDSPALQSRLRRMWSGYEDAVTAAVLSRDPDAGPAAARLEAMLVIALVRSLTSAEVRVLVSEAADPRDALLSWIGAATARLRPSAPAAVTQTK
jgi:AcrR family transcriptional regulator